MIRNSAPLVLVLLAFAVTVLPADAQETDTRPGVAVAPDRIDRLSRSLDDIARSLRQLLDAEKVQIVIRRIELEERRLAPQSSELRSARSEVRNLHDEIGHMKAYLQELEAEAEGELLAGTDQDRAVAREQLEIYGTEIRLAEDRLATAERRVVDLEIELTRGRDRVDLLDERLMELLEASGE